MLHGAHHLLSAELPEASHEKNLVMLGLPCADFGKFGSAPPFLAGDAPGFARLLGDDAVGIFVVRWISLFSASLFVDSGRGAAGDDSDEEMHLAPGEPGRATGQVLAWEAP